MQYLIDIITCEQEVLLNKIMMENPGVPCFLLGHSTGGAVVLKVCSYETEQCLSTLFRPGLDTDPISLGLWTMDTMTGREMVQNLNKVAWLKNGLATDSHFTRLVFVLSLCSSLACNLAGIFVPSYQRETGRDHPDITSSACETCPSYCWGNATTLFSCLFTIKVHMTWVILRSTTSWAFPK